MMNQSRRRVYPGMSIDYKAGVDYKRVAALVDYTGIIIWRVTNGGYSHQYAMIGSVTFKFSWIIQNDVEMVAYWPGRNEQSIPCNTIPLTQFR
jgi:hypothetical protein